MRRYMAIILAMLLLNVGGTAEQATDISFKLTDQDIWYQDMVNVALELKSENKVYAAQYELEFTGENLAFVEMAQGEETRVLVKPFQQEGKVVCGFTFTGDNEGAENIKETFRFQAVGEGAAKITISSMKLIYTDSTKEENEPNRVVEFEIYKEKPAPTRRPSGGGGGGGITVPSVTVTPRPTITPSPTPEMSPTPSPEPTPGIEKFKDLESVAWATEEINYLAEQNILNGDPSGFFRPEDHISRAEYVKMLVAAFSFQESGEKQFKDLLEDEWYYDSMQAAAANGIVKGYDDGTIRPGEPVTREDAAVMLFRCGEYPKSTEFLKPFTDAQEIQQYAKESVISLAEAGILSGMPDGGFHPKEKITRAETAVMLAKALRIGE